MPHVEAQRKRTCKKCSKVSFIVSFIGALAASGVMIWHESKAKNTGHENMVVPLILFWVQILKLPALYEQLKDQKALGNRSLLVDKLLLLGTFIAGVIWFVAFMIAANWI